MTVKLIEKMQEVNAATLKILKKESLIKQLL
jgi:hypothetical protein